MPGVPDPMGQVLGSNVAEAAFSTPTMFGDSVPTPFTSLSNIMGGFAAYSAKIADNSSPRPLDRVYAGYNYYNNIGGQGISANVETIGFEKTFLDGNASFGMRLPFMQLTGAGNNLSSVGDLTISVKYAFINDPTTGNVLSGGLAITFPTGPCITTTGGSSINPTFFQPFAGYLVNSGDAFVHGFSSIIVPTDSRDVTLWFNDIGVGYWLYRDDTQSRLVRAIVPTFEVHINTPLTHRYPGAATDPNSVIFADDVNLTMGATFFLRGNSSLGAAFAMPVTGPRPYTGEAIVQFNYRY
jgi:hypothetical protein